MVFDLVRTDVTPFLPCTPWNVCVGVAGPISKVKFVLETFRASFKLRRIVIVFPKLLGEILLFTKVLFLSRRERTEDTFTKKVYGTSSVSAHHEVRCTEQ